jgi:hypothetical protein
MKNNIKQALEELVDDNESINGYRCIIDSAILFACECSNEPGLSPEMFTYVEQLYKEKYDQEKIELTKKIILSDIKEGEISKDCKLTDYVDVVEELEGLKKITLGILVSHVLKVTSLPESRKDLNFVFDSLITKLKGNSTESKNSIVCPYCGSKDVDIGHLLEDNGKKLCFKCKKTYSYEAVKLTEEGSYWKTFKLKGK